MWVPGAGRDRAGRPRSAPAAAGAAALVLALGAACDRREPPAAGPGPPGPSPTGAGAEDAGRPPVFAERAAETGIDFVQFNGMSGAYYMAEVTGSGGALFDYDGDGDLDLYLQQGTMLGPGKKLEDALFPAPDSPTDRLFRNELVPGGTLRFTDVTVGSGLDRVGYAMGVAAGDYDNDGRVDLYVTNFGANFLLRNDGGNGFRDETLRSGSDDPRWSVAATFFDYDRDGWLDLFVGNYIDADLVHRPTCRDFTGALDYCGPGAFEPLPDRLFHNRGDGTFEDVTRSAGLRGGFGGALGVVAADLDGDGWPDLYVANDARPNNLWINKGDGTFHDNAVLAGCAVNGAGKAESSMGVEAADFDGDGDLDLFLTHLTGETNTLYENDGAGIFADVTARSGLGAPSIAYTSFGTGALDYDNDGWLDLLVVNGAVKKIEALARRGDPFPVHQPNQLFRNLGGGRFVDATAEAGEAFRLSEVSRGALFGDLDNDGDTDALVANNNGPPRLLINELGNRRPWLGLRLVGRRPPRDMLGALVVLERRGAAPLLRRVRSDGSFASANDPRVLFGLGDHPAVERVRVQWPDGSSEEWTGLATGRYVELEQGGGRPPGASS